jgi:hypothetical protein
LNSYFRKEFFGRCKFVHPDVISMESETMKTCFTMLQIQDDEKAKKSKYPNICKLIKRAINSKRNYVTETLIKKVKGVSLYWMFLHSSTLSYYCFLLQN